MSWLRNSAMTVLTCAIAVASGCGGGGGKVDTVQVEGTVNIDGAPLEEGYITFNPSMGEGVPAGMEIKAGKFSGPVPPGTKNVSINSSVVVGERKKYDTPDSETVKIFQEGVAKEFNSATTLTAEIPAGGKNDLSFEVKANKGVKKK
ncbi:hypothetical protein SH668x_001818 [Planctomicrobium sp. SH668]|uniref:hypothetical protein n=1 Tax=Planctomicrobium sp. SH668 TaxID=3448126 RepID=UPI003F5AECC2